MEFQFSGAVSLLTRAKDRIAWGILGMGLGGVIAIVVFAFITDTLMTVIGFGTVAVMSALYWAMITVLDGE